MDDNLAENGEFEIAPAISQLACDIMQGRTDLDDVVILGIPKRGVPLANRLASKLGELVPSFDPNAQTGQLDITMYRDDLRRQPTRAIGVTKVPNIDGKTVILVDDVLASGRTVRAALDALSDLGRPAVVRLAVLVNRGDVRQFPIAPDYHGYGLAAGAEHHIKVQLAETDGQDAIIVEPLNTTNSANGNIG